MKSFDFALLLENARKAAPANRAFFKSIKQKSQLRRLDNIVHELHDEVFEEVDCLSCANCCRTLGPRISHNDINRAAYKLKIKPSIFVEKYLRIDEDNDYVFKSMPCPFLGDDNYCAIYDARPSACREYPHTDRVNFHQISTLTIKNAETCPAVYEILERLRDEF